MKRIDSGFYTNGLMIESDGSNWIDGINIVALLKKRPRSIKVVIHIGGSSRTTNSSHDRRVVVAGMIEK